MEYDLIVIGSGAGGGTLARALSGHKRNILVLERGDFVPKSPDNADPKSVFADGNYVSPDEWLDEHGKPFQPQSHYNVGGATKFYGAALYRLREKDFTGYATTDGYSSAWPISYADLEPYYAKAERLYRVHGARGEDPTEGPSSKDYDYPALEHSPYLQTVSDKLAKAGYQPFHSPSAVDYGNGDCIRCNSCDGFACQYGAKGDAETVLTPAMHGSAPITLVTNTEVATVAEHTVTTTDGRTFYGKVIVIAAGAVNSAALLLRSGLGNDLVGRNYMCHNSAAMMTIMPEKNDAQFEKTLAIADWMNVIGSVQMMGKSTAWAIKGEQNLPGWFPNGPLKMLTNHALDWWLMSEDTPSPENRVTLVNGKIKLSVRKQGVERLQQLKKVLLTALRDAGLKPMAHAAKNMPLSAVAHQAGTCRFGDSPATSALDVNCKLWGSDSIYVVDASFMPSVGAVNPALTIAANALRVADHIKKVLA